MADFKTHVCGAALVSGCAAAAFDMATSTSDVTVLSLFGLGVVGGMLPDLDSDNSVPVRIAFNLLSIVSGFLPVFRFADSLSLLELLVIGLSSFACVRYVVFAAFTRFTVHRGLMHSLPCALVAGQLAALLADRCLGLPSVLAWASAAFVSGGFVVHLVLDELCSVDLMGRRIKRSFGTALSLGKRGNGLGTFTLYAAVAMLSRWTPPADAFLRLVRDPDTLGVFSERLLP